MSLTFCRAARAALSARSGALRRQDVGVRIADRADVRAALLLVEVPDEVCAEQLERVPLACRVPEPLDLDGGREVSGSPEEIDHFAVRADARRRRGAACELVEHISDDAVEAIGVRPSADHELGEERARVEANELPGRQRACEVARRISFDPSENALRVIGMSDGEETLACLQSGAEELSYGVEEELLALVQLDRVGMSVRPLQECRIHQLTRTPRDIVKRDHLRHAPKRETTSTLGQRGKLAGK